VYDYVSGFYRKHDDGSEQLENGRLALFRNFDEGTLNPLPRRNGRRCRAKATMGQ
jgi:type III restriction enzyme